MEEEITESSGEFRRGTRRDINLLPLSEGAVEEHKDDKSDRAAEFRV